jgi:hypothetical protein
VIPLEQFKAVERVMPLGPTSRDEYEPTVEDALTFARGPNFDESEFEAAFERLEAWLTREAGVALRETRHARNSPERLEPWELVNQFFIVCRRRRGLSIQGEILNPAGILSEQLKRLAKDARKKCKSSRQILERYKALQAERWSDPISWTSSEEDEQRFDALCQALRPHINAMTSANYRLGCRLWLNVFEIVKSDFESLKDSLRRPVDEAWTHFVSLREQFRSNTPNRRGFAELGEVNKRVAWIIRSDSENYAEWRSNVREVTTATDTIWRWFNHGKKKLVEAVRGLDIGDEV